MFRFDTFRSQLMTCDRCRALVSDDVDAVSHSAAVHAHLETCADCSAFLRDIRTLRSDLRALPRPDTSAGFEAALLARLAAAPRRTFWTVRREVLRPVFAVAAAAVMCVALFVHPAAVSVISTPPIVSSTTAPDPSLVQQCVTIHGAAAAAQPLADPAAQTLNEHLASTSASDALGSSL